MIELTELTELTLRQASELLAGGETSAVELLEATLRQIDATEPLVHAYAYVAADQARAAAATADQERARGVDRGPVHGIPVGIKDLLYTTDMPTEAGSKVFAGFAPAFDATAVRRLREAGAVIVGKTVTHEFAYGQDVRRRATRGTRSATPVVRAQARASRSRCARLSALSAATRARRSGFRGRSTAWSA